MDLHLFTTDRSALDLIGRLPGGDRVACLVVAENRAGSDKVARLGAAAGEFPVRPAPSVKESAGPPLFHRQLAVIPWSVYAVTSNFTQSRLHIS